MKKITLGVFAIALSVASFAQTGNKEARRAERETHAQHEKKDGFKGRDFQDKLNLNDQQKQQMKSLRDEFQKQRKDLKDNTSLSDDQKKQQMKDLAKQQHEKMQAILTPEQKQQAEKLRSEWKDKKKGESKDDFAGRDKRGDKMEKQLNLTDAQSTQLKSINESFKTGMQAIRNNSALTAEQKKEQAKELQQKHREQVQSLLTAEQKAKMKENMKNHKDRKAVK